jgi:hypothetical protein
MRSVPLLFVALAISAPASAANFDFSFSGTNLFGLPALTSGSGTFTTSDTAMQVGGRTAFTVTGISGSLNGSAINGLAGGFLGSNNLYYTTGPSFVDGSGIGFTTTGGTFASLYYQDSIPSYRLTTTGPFATGFVTASSSQTATSAAPEPASWALMVGGFGLVGGAMRRRQRTDFSFA